MISRFAGRLRCAACLALAALVGCADSTDEPGVKLYTFAVGVFDDDGQLTPSEVVPYETGSLYGYELTVHSTSGKVRVREVLELPEAGVWSDDKTAPPGITILEQRAAEDGKSHVEEFDIECGDKMARIRQVYEIVDGDPAGTYKFMISIDGELAEEVSFQVEKAD